MWQMCLALPKDNIWEIQHLDLSLCSDPVNYGFVKLHNFLGKAIFVKVDMHNSIICVILFSLAVFLSVIHLVSYFIILSFFC